MQWGTPQSQSDGNRSDGPYQPYQPYEPYESHRPSYEEIPTAPVLPAMPHLPEVTFSQNDLKVIAAIRCYMDSLQTTPEGRLKYDQLAKSRPGLLDSLKIMEHLLLR